MRELGNLARREDEAEKARLDDRWDRLAAGTLTAEEDAELKALAASSPEAHEIYEAFRPLGADFQARVVSAINKQVPSPEPLPLPPLPFPPDPPPPSFLFRRVMRRAEVWVGLAAAAGVFFLVRTQAPLVRTQAPELISSGYAAAARSGGSVPSRGGETAQKRTYPLDSAFILDIYPRQPLEHPGKLKARAYLSTSAGREDLKSLGLENKFDSAGTGSVHLDKVTMGEDIKVKPGDWIFWTVVARKSLPEAREVQTRLRANRPQSDSWQTVCDALTQEKNPPPAPWQVACASFHAEGQPAP
ncbi:MAG TPA: hypothetical protein VIA62_01170 [Thermoanaerobaculia bacterium]|nr:hypothetical protein [Thermoanaerobaculia bacterium]